MYTYSDKLKRRPGWIPIDKQQFTKRWSPKAILARYTSPLLSRAIKLVDLNKVRENKAGKVLGTPWVRLPNVKSFNVQLKTPNPIYAIFGIKRNYAPTLMLEEYKLRKINRFIEHQVRRLLLYRKNNPRLYWNLALLLMKRSNVWRVMAINHVLTKWYRNYPLGFVINLNRKVSKIINGGRFIKPLTRSNYIGQIYMMGLIFKRVYIPKDNKKFRPLGVPSTEWRVLLHMYSNFLTCFVQDNLPGQHGFLPNKGTLTAWK
jgi:hypothetical protein